MVSQHLCASTATRINPTKRDHTCCLVVRRNRQGILVSTRGFEPPTPGFIPLRLSPPSEDVRGLDCPFTMSLTAFRCCPSSLYTFTRFL